MDFDGKKRVIIDKVTPQIDGGNFPIKRVIGEEVVVKADIFVDGSDKLEAVLIFFEEGKSSHESIPMKFTANDVWEATFIPKKVGIYFYTIEAWIDRMATWCENLKKRMEAKQNLEVEVQIGAEYLKSMTAKAKGDDEKKIKEWYDLFLKGNISKSIEIALSEEFAGTVHKYTDKKFVTKYAKELKVVVDRKRALCSSWYEFFPRSCPQETGKHGTFNDCKKILPEIARMGFDVIYLPPIHPIGQTNRKGKNNNPQAQKDEPGSPWAIGSKEGGHKSVHPELGTMKDFESFVKEATRLEVEIALDIAFQCSPDHPYVKEHPQWFKWRPDGTIQYAENPPKKYEDIIPLDFECDDWKNLWEELKSVFLFWIEKGIKIFRVDNPHTKPFRFWHWIIGEVKKDYPDVMFLAEAFTRPKLMYRLAKCGFTQSYTYFTWRNTKGELEDYINELTRTELREYFRPNFWTNTPDILPEYLQYGGRPAFIARLVLAATLSSNYGMYGPAYEQCVSKSLHDKEEYTDSEKYEIKRWEPGRPESLRELISRVNKIRKENRALHTPWNITFCQSENENIICYAKADESLENVLVIAVNLNPYHAQSGRIRVPLEKLGIPRDHHYLMHDILRDEKYVWQGEWNHVELDPKILPANIFVVRKKLKRENDFDYFM